MPKKPRPKPTAEQKREAAQQRLEGFATKADTEYGRPVGRSLFTSGRESSRSVGRSRTHTLGPIRITEELAERLAEYGNDLGLNQSDTVRKLLAEALERRAQRRRRREKR